MCSPGSYADATSPLTPWPRGRATELFLDGKDDATIDHLAKQPPLERLGTPADIGGVATFLTGSAGHWVNGQVIRANSGMM